MVGDAPGEYRRYVAAAHSAERDFRHSTDGGHHQQIFFGNRSAARRQRFNQSRVGKDASRQASGDKKPLRSGDVDARADLRLAGGFHAAVYFFAECRSCNDSAACGCEHAALFGAEPDYG